MQLFPANNCCFKTAAGFFFYSGPQKSDTNGTRQADKPKNCLSGFILIHRGFSEFALTCWDLSGFIGICCSRCLGTICHRFDPHGGLLLSLGCTQGSRLNQAMKTHVHLESDAPLSFLNAAKFRGASDAGHKMRQEERMAAKEEGRQGAKQLASRGVPICWYQP